MTPISRPAPLAGLDLASPITAVKNGFGLRLDNWVCRSDGLHTRNGFGVVNRHQGAITALASYAGHLVAATATALYDGNLDVATVQNGGEWSAATIANDGGNHLIAVNGRDAPRWFNGQSWSAATFSGVDGAALSQIITHQRRLFAVERDSLRLWYFGHDAIGGPASPMYLEAQCQRGGHVVAIATQSPTGGRGREQQLVVVTSNGELIVYAGTNPDERASWSLVGVWDVPNPVGPKCFAKMGAALMLLTVKGLLAVPALLAVPDSEKPSKSVSSMIDDEMKAAGRSVIESASNEMLLIDCGAVQYVRSDTGGWTRLVDVGGIAGAATCWCEHDGDLYFGTTDGRVCKYTGDADGDAPIRSFAVDAFSRLNSPTIKRFTRARSLYTGAHPYMPRIELLTDYKTPPLTWHAANIDDRYWQWSDVTYPRMPMPWMREVSAELQPWRSVGGRGVAVATMKSMQSRTPVIWTGTELMFDAGGRP